MVKRKDEKKVLHNAQKSKTDKHMGKRTFYKDLVSKSTVDFLHKMQYDDAFIEKWQRSRMLRAGLFVFAAIVVHIALGKLPVTLGILAMGIMLYVYADKGVSNAYVLYRFQRNLAFAKFTRLVVPYLRADGGGTESKVYTTLSSVVRRLDDPQDQQLLSQLLSEISEDPEDKKPYQRYAERMGGDDFALTFMETIYDIRQGATNLDIIENLARDSSKRVQKLTGDIVKLKERKLYNFLTMVIMSLIIPILGIVVSIIIDGLSVFWQGGMGF